MADERWQRQWDIFHAALDLPEDERRRFVASQSAGDTDLDEAVNNLLAAHEEANPMLDTPAVTAAAFGSDLDPESLIGETVDDYLLRAVIGEGGMGVVYEAMQQPLGRKVALKLIRLGMDTRQVVARFDAERQALAKMNHRNIAQVIDAGATENGRPYFVMEFIDGDPITEHCDARRLTNAERLELFLDVCAGVQHAHQKGIIHRDLKPTNVLIAHEDGKAVPKIIDFGIAKATAQRMAERSAFTQAGVLIGTPEYMSPEQAALSEAGVDTRTDVYSLGVLLYELLIGALPFEPDELRGAAYDEICRCIREKEPPRPSLKLSTLEATSGDLAERRRTNLQSLARWLRGDLDWITMRALEKQPDRRYASPSDLAADLRRHINDEPVLAGPPSASYRIGKFVRRHTLAVAAGSLVAVSLVVGLSAATYGLIRAQQAEAMAREEARTAEEVAEFMTQLFRVSEPSAVDVNSITARSVLDNGVARIRDELGSEPAVQSRLMLEMGNVYAQLGLLEEAERLLRDALRTRLNTPEFDDRTVAEVTASLAGVRHLAGAHQEAVELYLRALELGQADADPLWLATLHRSLGGVYQTMGRYSDSIATLQDARARLQTEGLVVSAEYARVLRNLGVAQWSAGDYEAARTAYDESLAVYDQVLEDGHPEVSYVVNALAILNYNLGDYEAARPMFERELANLERTLGPEHRNTASILNNLGLLLLAMELYEEARPKILESLRIREQVLGPEHEEVATSLFNLARLQVADGNFEEARESLERCLAIRETTLGADHIYVAGTLELLASVERELGDESAALSHESRAQTIRASAGG